MTTALHIAAAAAHDAAADAHDARKPDAAGYSIDAQKLSRALHDGTPTEEGFYGLGDAGLFWSQEALYGKPKKRREARLASARDHREAARLHREAAGQ